MNKALVYVHITPNNKLYIGITTKSLKVRCGKDGIGYRTQKLFWRAIQKYGWNNIQHIILIENIPFEVATEVEKYLIKLYDTTNPKNGYNISSGGEYSNLGCTHSEETREKMRKNHSHCWKGKHHSEESKKKMSDAKRGKPSKLKGVPKSLVTRKLMSENNAMHTDYGYANWYKATHNPEYVEKLRNAALNMSDETKLKISVAMSKPVAQYDLQGNLITIYKSITDASNITGITPLTIRRSCNNLAKPRKYIWRFVDK